jgi:hypothetical protein
LSLGSAIPGCFDSGRAKSIKALDALMIFTGAPNAKLRLVKSLTSASTARALIRRDLSEYSSHAREWPRHRFNAAGALHNIFATVAPLHRTCADHRTAAIGQ